MSVTEEVLTFTCKNCETSFEGKYCPNCSQKANTHRFTVKHLSYEVFHALTHTDKGILFLIKEMFRRPGKVALEFNAGKRKKYFNPVTFLLIATGLNVYLSQKTDFYGIFLNKNIEFVQSLAKHSPQTSNEETIEPLIKTKATIPKIMENSKLLSLIVLPFLALLTWLFYKKSGFNYAENLILNVLVQGQLSVIFILFCLVPFLLYEPLVMVLPYLYFITIWLFSLRAYRQFFNQRKWVNFFKGTLIFVIYFYIQSKITSYLVEYL